MDVYLAPDVEGLPVRHVGPYNPPGRAWGRVRRSLATWRRVFRRKVLLRRLVAGTRTRRGRWWSRSWTEPEQLRLPGGQLADLVAVEAWRRDVGTWREHAVEPAEGRWFLARRPAHKCNGQVVTAACSKHGVRRHLWIPEHHCKQRSCTQPGCMEHVERERARGAVATLGRLGDVPWLKLELTLPTECHHVALTDRATLKLWTDKVWHLVATWIGEHLLAGLVDAPSWAQLGGVVVLHPEGSKGKPHPHFNVLIPMQLYDRRQGAGRAPSWRAFRTCWGRAFDRAQADLRGRWALELEAAGWDGRCELQVNIAYRKTLEARHHSARYVYRPWPTWAEWVTRPRYQGALASTRLATLPAPPSLIPLPAHPLADWYCECCGARLLVEWRGRLRADRHGADPPGPEWTPIVDLSPLAFRSAFDG